MALLRVVRSLQHVRHERAERVLRQQIEPRNGWPTSTGSTQ